jgi:hypothetical protein
MIVARFARLLQSQAIFKNRLLGERVLKEELDRELLNASSTSRASARPTSKAYGRHHYDNHNFLPRREMRMDVVLLV